MTMNVMSPTCVHLVRIPLTASNPRRSVVVNCTAVTFLSAKSGVGYWTRLRLGQYACARLESAALSAGEQRQAGPAIGGVSARMERTT